jgi:hypothetical protein
VNSLEDRVRDAYQAAAATVRPDTLRPMPAECLRLHAPRTTDRASRPAARLAIPLAAAATVAVIAITASLVSAPGTTRPRLGPGRHAAPRPVAVAFPASASTVAQGYASGRLPASAPPAFFVGVVQPRSPITEYANDLDVFSSSSGRQVARVYLPQAGLYVQTVAAVAADTFVAAATMDFPHAGCKTWLYQFHLTAAGQPTAMRPFADPEVAGWAWQLAGSADGSTAELTTLTCASGGREFVLGQSTTTVISLPSGSTARMSPGRVLEVQNSPSATMSADGGMLEVIAIPGNPRGLGTQEQAAYVMLTGAMGGPPARRYREIFRNPKGVLADAISPDGRVSFAIVLQQRSGRMYREQVVAVDTATGRIIKVLAASAWASGWNGEPTMIMDPSGRYLLLLGLGAGNTQVLDIATGLLRTVPVSYAYPPNYTAW